MKSKITSTKTKSLNPASISVSKKRSVNGNQRKNLRVIDQTVRAGFLSLSVAILTLAIVSGALTLLNSTPTEFAKAQSNPNDPGAGPVALPGQNTQQTPSAQITGITISNGNYVVNFTKTNFDGRPASVKPNFYFNTTPTSRTAFDGASPYTVAVSTKPAGATELCVQVIDGNDGVFANSGNCVTLPNNSGGNTNQNPTSPTPDTPATPSVSGEVIGVGGGTGNETVTTTTQPTTNTNSGTTNPPQSQALTAAQQAGTTARSGGLSVVTGLILLGLVGYYVYYQVKGDRKAILKTAEKKINLKK